MEPIKIHFSFNKQKFIKAQFIRWEIETKKAKRETIIIIIIGLISIFAGISQKSYFEQINPLLIFGSFSLIISCYNAYYRIARKIRFKKEVNKIADVFDEMVMDCDFEFTEREVKYSDKEKKLEYTWPLFSEYRIYKGHLILYINDFIINMHLFDLKDLEIETKKRLLELINSKIPNKD